jgi:L-fucose isomerase-like protein
MNQNKDLLENQNSSVDSVKSKMTLEQAKSFIDQLGKQNLIYHFDDDAVECLMSSTTLERAKEIQKTVNQIYASDLDWGKHDCPIGYCLYVLEKNGVLKNNTHEKPKTVIPTETWVELYATLSSYILEYSSLDPIWIIDEDGNEVRTEEKQNEFINIANEVENILHDSGLRKGEV